MEIEGGELGLGRWLERWTGPWCSYRWEISGSAKLPPAWLGRSCTDEALNPVVLGEGVLRDTYETLFLH